MTTKYAIVNPQTGMYEYVNDATEIDAKVAEIAIAFYFAHTHNSPVSKIEIDDSGAETWYSMNNDIINQSVVTSEIKTITGHTTIDGVTV